MRPSPKRPPFKPSRFRPLAEIPGYKEAVDRERILRAEAFLGLPTRLGVFDVRPMNLEDMSALLILQNTVLCKPCPDAEDVAIFIRRLSPTYTNGSFLYRLWFDLRFRRLYVVPSAPIFKTKRAVARYVKNAKATLERSQKLVGQVREFIDETFLDAPTGQAGGTDKDYFSDAAFICAKFGREFGWSEADTMSKPLRRVFQYLKEIKWTNSEGKNPSLTNKSESVLAENLRKQNAVNG